MRFLKKIIRSPLFLPVAPLFILTFLISISFAQSDNILGKKIYKDSGSQKQSRSQSGAASRLGPEAIRGQANGRTLGSSGSSFETGVEEGQPSWSGWGLQPVQRSVDPYAGFRQIAYDPSLKVRDPARFRPEADDDDVALVDKMNALIESVGDDVAQVERRANRIPESAGSMVDSADLVYEYADRMYDDIGVMYAELDPLYAALERNYAQFEQVEATPDAVSAFNTASDAMADRASRMGRAVDGMIAKMDVDRQNFDGLMAALDHLEQDGQAALKFCDELTTKIDAATGTYKELASALDQQNPYEYFPSRMSLPPDVFKDQKEYLKELKKYIQNNGLKNVDEVRQYLSGAKSYIGKVLADLAATAQDFGKAEEYFRKAKVGGGRGERDLMEAGAESESNVCTEAETKGMDTLQNCSKSCRTVCRWKEKVEGRDCYECPSGSPDSCWDVGAWPENHPWCQAGGPCYDDPMLYCVPFGTIGPNLEKLQCTNCKQRPDMCWQRVGGGTTYTNCKLGCWNGKCVYKGKYQENEWDGKPEFVHCYECQTPPPPPTCEELNWGYDWESDCKKDCPDPGQCEEYTMPGGKKKEPKKDDAPDNDDDDGDDQDGPGGGTPPGGDEGGKSGGTTGEDTGDSDDGDVDKPTPPTGSPQQPGGGGAVAGGKQPVTEEGAQQAGGEIKKPQQPTTTQPQQPDKPEAKKPDITDGHPPEPPNNAEIEFLKSRIKQTDEIIKNREEIISDPQEGEGVRAEAASQLESYRKEREQLEEKLKQEEQEELERRHKEAEEKARMEEAQKRRDASRTRWPDPQVEMQKIRLKELKDALEQMKNFAQEGQDALNGRKEHIERLDREIALTKREIEHHKDAKASGGTIERHADERIKALEKELAHKNMLRNELAKKLQEAQQKFSQEFDKYKRTYFKKLYAADENIRRQEDARRTDEFFELQTQLDHVRASRDERNRAFEEKFKEMETRIADAKANGDEDTAEKLQEQLENMKRGKEDWDKQYETQEKTLENQLYTTGYHTNFEDGVGPTNREELIEKVNEYGGILDNEIAATEKRIAELEQALKEGKIGTSVRADGSEHVHELDEMRARLENLKSSREAITEKQNTLKNGYKLPDDIAENIRNSTDRYAEGSKNRGPDKSMARLIGESLVEEAAHNLRPDIAAKKSLAFAVGVVKGVGSAVKGLAELGIGAIDLTIEMHLTNLGFDIETDALDALNNMLSGVGNNANFDGVIKAVVAAGGAIDAQIKKLEKSGDIDWATAELGGKVAGETVVGDAVIAGVVGKAGRALGLMDEAADAGRAGSRAAGVLDDASGAGRATGSVTGKAEDLNEAARAAERAGEGTRARGAGSAPVEAPKVKPPETPPAKPWEPSTTVGQNSDLNFVNKNGDRVSMQTGERLGSGSTSTVYADAVDPKKVIRVTEIDGQVLEATKLDEAGRQALEEIQKKAPDGPVRIVEQHSRHTVENLPGNSQLNNKVVEVVERVDGTAKDMLAKQPGGTMTRGQAEAFDQATRELNKNGYAWLDNHNQNYTFEKIPGEDKWRVVVIDPGGVVPMKGATLAERAENARALQSRINVPSDDFRQGMSMTKNPDVQKMVAGEEWGNIINDHGGNIDIGKMGITDPSQVKFYPGGVLDYEDAQKLFTRTADEAAAAAKGAPPKTPDITTAPAQGPPDAPPSGKAPASKTTDAAAGPRRDGPSSRGPPEPPRRYDNRKPLPDSNTPTAKKPVQLSDEALETMEKKQGFRQDHAQRMNEFAQEKNAYLLVRDGNPDSVKYFGDGDKVPKPMSSKAKTAKVGPDQGLVVDPTHPKQKQYWAEAKKKAAAHAVKTGDYSELDKLNAAHKKALKSWNDYGEEMLHKGYQVDKDTGRVLLKTTDADGKEVFKAVHGDYDLHGVYRKAPDGKVEHVSFGEGQKFDANGKDISGGDLRRQLNDKISAGQKDFIQHGGQDDWVPDPHMVPVKPPDPPVTVFFPDGRPPLRLKNAEDMKTFYEGEMGVKWSYPEPKK